jgi:hypothetical protein
MVFNGFDVSERRPDPRLIEKFLARYESDTPAGILSFFEKLISLMFASDADDMIFHNELTGPQASLPA